MEVERVEKAAKPCGRHRQKASHSHSSSHTHIYFLLSSTPHPISTLAPHPSSPAPSCSPPASLLACQPRSLPDPSLLLSLTLPLPPSPPPMAHDSSKLDNEEPGCQAPELSSRCVNNCGFFGSPATSNFCSRCYAEVVVKTKPSYPAAEKISASDPSSKLLGEPAGGMAELGLQLASFAAKSVAEERAVSDPAAQIQELEIGVAELGTRAVEIEVSSVASTSSRTDVPGIVTDVLRAATVFEVSGHQPQRPTPNRCLTCRKRVGLTGFKCRCGDVFCALHRYSDKHNCSYDYKAAGREAIAKANPIVVARKIEKI